MFALCLAAGLDGIEKNLKAPAEMTESIRKMTEEEKKQKGIQDLPENLGEALDAMENDELIREVLGEKFTAVYTKTKKKEWKSYLAQVSEWELERYLYSV